MEKELRHGDAKLQRLLLLSQKEQWNIDDLKVAADAELHSLIKGEWKRLDKIARASKPKRIASKSSDSR